MQNDKSKFKSWPFDRLASTRSTLLTTGALGTGRTGLVERNMYFLEGEAPMAPADSFNSPRGKCERVGVKKMIIFYF